MCKNIVVDALLSDKQLLRKFLNYSRPTHTLAFQIYHFKTLKQNFTKVEQNFQIVAQQAKGGAKRPSPRKRNI